MDYARIVEFTSNHPVLILAFVATLGLLLYSEISRRLSGMKQIGPTDATRLSNHDNAVFLDVRDDGEYRNGHIPQAIHIPLKQLPQRIKELDRFKSGPLIAYCRSGSRTLGAAGVLKKHGFENVYNLSGGIAAWQKSNLPVSTK